jgi:hypothetical protein
VLRIKMSESEGKKKAAFQPPPSPILPRRPEFPEEEWPSPVPMPAIPTEDVGRVLKQILERLDAIEKRLEKIEGLLAAK